MHREARSLLQQSGSDDAIAERARLEKPFLRTSVQLTVGHLKKYLSKTMRLGDEVRVESNVPSPHLFESGLCPSLIDSV